MGGQGRSKHGPEMTKILKQAFFWTPWRFMTLYADTMSEKKASMHPLSTAVIFHFGTEYMIIV